MRSTLLYLGIDPSNLPHEGEIIHCPVIKIIPKSIEDASVQLAFENLDRFTHLIFTSKSAVEIFFKFLHQKKLRTALLKKKNWIAVGRATAAVIKQHMQEDLDILIPLEETSEGVVNLLKSLNMEGSKTLWPHSELSRNVIQSFFQASRFELYAPEFYTTAPNREFSLPDWSEVDAILFTSPSTVDVMEKHLPDIPDRIQIRSIGPVTAARLIFSLKMNRQSGLECNKEVK